MQLLGTNSIPSIVESRNGIGFGERYNFYLKKIPEKVNCANPVLHLYIALHIAFMAVNNTAGPSKPVPTLFVFEVMPRLPFRTVELWIQKERIATLVLIKPSSSLFEITFPFGRLVNARKSMASLSHQSKLRTGIHSNVPSAADRELVISQKFLMYQKKRMRKSAGPYTICQRAEKLLTLDTEDRPIKASFKRVKLFNFINIRPIQNLSKILCLSDGCFKL